MRSLPTKRVRETIEQVNKDWPKGGAHGFSILALTLLLDIRETLIEITEIELRRKLDEAK